MLINPTHVDNLVNNVNNEHVECRFIDLKFVIRTNKKNYMLGAILKKKLSDNQVANIFINAIFDSVEHGFSEVALLINEDVAFVRSPSIDPKSDNEFALIVLVGNLSYLESTFEPTQATKVENIVFEKLATIYGMSTDDFKKLIREYQNLISRINHPSKNMLYGMSKAVFSKYNLNEFQDEYFKRMQAPNPLFLKRMDDVMQNFIWNWDAFFKKYKIN